MQTLSVQGDQKLMKDVSVCISAIAGLEIPEGLWTDFVQVMTQQALQNDNMYYKMAGIHNIGLVMEDLDASHITENDSILIWGAMISNVEYQIDPNL